MFGSATGTSGSSDEEGSSTASSQDEDQVSVT